MQVFAESLIKNQKTADAERRQQKWNRQSCGRARQQEHSLPYRVLRGGNSEHSREDWSDARRPSKRERKSHQKSTPRCGLPTHVAEMHDAVQPARHHRSKEKNK